MRAAYLARRHDPGMDGVTIRPMARAELDVLVGWAAEEGWNPGLNDADLFWGTDPAGFVAAEAHGALVGGGSIVSYDGRFGFMGFFIVAPEHRGRGLGRRLWLHRRDALLARLRPGAAIGMDGVFAMQAFYARGGFRPAGRDLRMEGVGARAARTARLVDAREVPPAALAAYDAGRFPAPRPGFVRRWIAQPGARALAAVDAGEVRGYGVVRPCRTGFKIGPLFAADAEVAEDLFRGLGDHAAGTPLFLDVPEGNRAAMDLAGRHGMREVFGCARMYLGPPPAVAEHEVFGVTTLELG
jgi:GNAT superfamily N-acetyltransferase